VVGPVRDVRLIGCPSVWRGRLRVIQARHGKAQVLEDVAHPLRVAPGEVVVDGDQVCATAGERVEVKRQRGDEGLAFTGRHLGDLALVQHHATDELDVVGHHIPDELVSSHLHCGAEKPAAGLAHRGECLGEQIVEADAKLLLVVGLDVVKPALEAVPLHRVGAAVLGLAHLFQLGLEGADALLETLPEEDGLGLELILTQVLETLLVGVNRLDDRLEPLTLSIEPRTEDRGHQILDHSGSKYKRCKETYSATGSGTQCRIDLPSRTRCRMLVAEISMAGTRTVSEIAGRDGTSDPGRAKTTTRASRGISSASRQAGRSAATSAPSRRISSIPGSRARRARSVSTV